MSEFLTPEEIASWLRVSRRAVYGWLERGELPALRAGNRYRVEPAALDEYLKRPRETARTKREQEQGAVTAEQQHLAQGAESAAASPARSRPSAMPGVGSLPVSGPNVGHVPGTPSPPAQESGPASSPLAAMKRNKQKRR